MDKKNTEGFTQKIRMDLTMSTRPVGDKGFETLTNGEMECNCTTFEFVAFIKDLILGFTKNESERCLEFLKVLSVSLAEEFIGKKEETEMPTYSERTEDIIKQASDEDVEEDDTEIEMRVVKISNKEQAKKLLKMLSALEESSK